MPAETVFVLSLNSPVWVRTYVSEPDLGRIRPGRRSSCDPTPGERSPSKAVVGFISTAAEFTPKTVETRELSTALVYRIRVRRRRSRRRAAARDADDRHAWSIRVHAGSR